MILIEISKRDIMDLAKMEVRNLPGALFVGASPLLKPFMKKLECLLPAERMGRGDSYILSALHSHIDEVHADDEMIRVLSGDIAVTISRDELCGMVGEKYPSTDHQRLNLPGLLFLQSSPSIQAVAATKLRREHNLHIPEGRRTMRYIFHIAVTAIDADKEKIRISFDLERLPKRADEYLRQSQS
ncbi:MAG: hypothetical protein ACE14P_08895 [Methanotrichaceae archaeon]